MHKTVKTVPIVALLSAATPAIAGVALNEEEHINASLVSAAVAAIIADTCNSIEPRTFTGIVKAWQLKRYALDKGYTEDEIEAFLKDKKERERVRAVAETYLSDQGVEPGKPASYCRVGRAEIKADTLTGQLLKAN